MAKSGFEHYGFLSQLMLSILTIQSTVIRWWNFLKFSPKKKKPPHTHKKNEIKKKQKQIPASWNVTRFNW